MPITDSTVKRRDPLTLLMYEYVLLLRIDEFLADKMEALRRVPFDLACDIVEAGDIFRELHVRSAYCT
jgi:hypothetical protein